jgi:hypothetical protein
MPTSGAIGIMYRTLNAGRNKQKIYKINKTEPVNIKIFNNMLSRLLFVLYLLLMIIAMAKKNRGLMLIRSEIKALVMDLKDVRLKSFKV